MRLTTYEKGKQDSPAIEMFEKSWSRQKWPTNVASLILTACLVVEISNADFFPFANPL